MFFIAYRGLFYEFLALVLSFDTSLNNLVANKKYGCHRMQDFHKETRYYTNL
jgi:hypothetical protein